MATMATLKNPNRITGSRDHGICDFDGLITVTNIIEITIILKIEIQDEDDDDGDDDNDEEEDEEDEEEEEEEQEQEEEEDHDVDDDNHHRQNLRKVCFFEATRTSCGFQAGLAAHEKRLRQVTGRSEFSSFIQAIRQGENQWLVTLL